MSGAGCGGEQARDPSPAPSAVSRIVEVERGLRDRVALLSEGTVTGVITFVRVVARYEKRGREYFDIEVAVITADAPDQPLWTSWVTFTPTATLGAA